MNDLVNHKRNEYGMKEAARNFPMMVVLSFVYVCNALCPNCPYNNSDIREDYKDALFMSKNLFKKIADECGKYNSLLRLSGGGEPMMHPHALELIEYALEKGCRVGLITNGSIFDRESLTRMISLGIDAIEFSVDAGDEETYKWARPGLEWSTLNRNIKQAKSIRDELKSETRIICSAINQDGVDIELVQSYWEEKVDKVQIRKYLTWGYNDDNSADATPYLSPEERIPCPWLFERLNIDSRGNVTLCGEDIAFEKQFANVNERTILDIWNGQEIFHFRNLHLERRGNEIDICSKCPDWKYRSWNYNYWQLLKDAEASRDK